MDIELTTPSGPALAELDRPRGTPGALLVLTHGAGGGVRSVDVLAAHAAALAAGAAVALLTQPYRVAGRSAPPAPSKQDPAWLAALAELRNRRGLARLPLIVGGRSNGARVACRTATAAGADAVLALAFPLHPPGKPERSRIEELDETGRPVLVVQGERDPFGMPPTGTDREVVVVPGADHSLKRGAELIGEAVGAFVRRQVATVSGGARRGS